MVLQMVAWGVGPALILMSAPPVYIKRPLKMGPTDQCQLDGGAYGRIDAPFLWFQTFNETLEKLGFIRSPFDARTSALTSQLPEGQTKVHGVLEIRVDDGTGGGDEHFTKTIQQLRGIYSFGSYDEGEFTFTGIHFRQWEDGSIEMDQVRYLEKIVPVNIPRNRRVEPDSPLTSAEVQELRRINGRLQFAAVHTHLDISAKVGYLQSCINRATVKNLVEANRVSHEAKTHKVAIMVVPLKPENVTSCAFRHYKDNNSYQGMFIVVTDWQMLQNEKTVIAPVAWASKKITRVVRSTLSAEVVSLCGSVDRLSWLRLFWEWMKNPEIDIAHPEAVLQKAPRASFVLIVRTTYVEIAKHRNPGDPVTKGEESS